MIKCTIDGKICFPDIKDNIKVVKKNPFLNSKDSYTMDITFPMNIIENIAVFGAVCRINASKRIKSFDRCVLYADNRVVIEGSGRVTEITESTVKMQIMSGYSAIRYKCQMQKVYIDRIDYPKVDDKYKTIKHKKFHKKTEMLFVGDEIAAKGYVGDIDKYVFIPTYDIDTDEMANETLYTLDIHQDYNAEDVALFNAAVQPNLMMVMRSVMAAMGYDISHNAFDVYPWNRIVVANARQTTNCAYALPHWTAETFLDEFRNLFNASFVFDDSAKTVNIVSNRDFNTSKEVSYEVDDEFKVEYDEEGTESIFSSNVEYDLQGEDRTLDTCPKELLQTFPIVDYASLSDILAAIEQMDEQLRATRIFRDKLGRMFFWGHAYDNDGNEQGYALKEFGVFSPLYRDANSDTAVTLMMYPVDMVRRFYDWDFMVATSGSDHRWAKDGSKIKMRLTIPNALNPNGNDYIDYNEKGYVSVSNVLEDGESKDKEETEDSVGMPLMFVTGQAAEYSGYQSVIPLASTDNRRTQGTKDDAFNSFALSNKGYNTHYMGECHQTEDGKNLSTMDGNNQVCFRFITSDIPDPTDIFCFRNKRYVCLSIEINVTADGTEPLKTGYFYELT